MSRRLLAGIGIALLVSVIAAPQIGASGGGGCPPPITNGSTTTAHVKDWCFEPTGIHIRPGETITWVNDDPVAHTVTGANRAWGGYKRLRPDRSVSFRFDRAGVYPYYCVLHMGMIGTVVVRDGKVPEELKPADASKAVRRVGPAALSAASADLPVLPASAEQDGSPVGLLVGGATAAVGMALVARRSRRGRSER